MEFYSILNDERGDVSVFITRAPGRSLPSPWNSVGPLLRIRRNFTFRETPRRTVERLRP